jgi:hypothetical protein
MIGPLIGMVHLGPLPGAPRYAGNLSAIIEAARRDATLLAEAGFDALMVENFGDAPFHGDDVPDATVAALTRCVTAVTEACDLPIGVNVLRNDALAAVAIAAATGAAAIRVNVLSGTMFTDQGPLTGRAAEVARLRKLLAPDIEILADVHVKHAVPPAGWSLSDAARDTWERGGATGLVVSGSGTGHPLDEADLATVAAAVPDAPLYAGSGVTAASAPRLLEHCAGLIVGTAVKVDGATNNPVDPAIAAAFVEAVRG